MRKHFEGRSSLSASQLLNPGFMKEVDQGLKQFRGSFGPEEAMNQAKALNNLGLTESSSGFLEEEKFNQIEK